MDYHREIQLEAKKLITRRWFFRDCGLGLGAVALASLLNEGKILAGPAQSKAVNPFTPRAPHFAPKAKRVIYLFQAGAPSQLDLFDYKPALLKYDGKPIPQEIVRDSATLSSSLMRNYSPRASNSPGTGNAAPSFLRFCPISPKSWMTSRLSNR